MSNRFINAMFGLSLLAAGIAGCASAPGGSSSQINAQTKSDRSNSNTDSFNYAKLPSTRPNVTVKSESAELFQQSLIALQAADLRRAEGLLSEVTELQPELSGPWLNLGQVYLAGERASEAQAAFERAIAANPTNCAAYNQLGVLARQQGELQRAEESYLACIERDPNFPQVYLNLGILYELYMGRLPQALDAYRKYQKLVETEDPKVAGWVLDLERRL